MKLGKKIVLYSITLGTWVLSQFGIGNSQYVHANETGAVNSDDNIFFFTPQKQNGNSNQNYNIVVSLSSLTSEN